MISALSWIPNGACRRKPVRFELSQDEVQRIENLAKEEAVIEKEQRKNFENDVDDLSSEDGSAQEEEEKEKSSGNQVGDSNPFEGLPPELRMDEYDDEADMKDILELDNDDDDDDNFLGDLGDGMASMELEEDEDDEDHEDDIIKPSDSVLLLAMTEDEYSHLEVQVFTKEGSLYTHHDIILPDFPLALAWMDCPPFKPSATAASNSQHNSNNLGSYIAVGTMDPAIEIWNLDILDPIEPSAILGGEDTKSGGGSEKSNKLKSKKKPLRSVKKRYLPGSHEGAVMSLSWNSNFRSTLASGSADHTVKIWDVTTQTCSYTSTHHTDKVNGVSWHPSEAWLLSTASFDKTISLVDCRSVSITKGCSLPSDIEALLWDPFQCYHLYASMENGQVICLDIRNIEVMKNHSKSCHPYHLFTAHDDTVSSMAFSSSVKGMLATASLDATVKIWDVNSLQESESHQFISSSESLPASGKSEGKKSKKTSSSSSSSSSPLPSSSLSPKCIAYKTMNVGKLFSLKFHQTNPFLLASAGDQGKVAIWESDEMETIKNHFQNKIYEVPNPYLAGREGEVDEDDDMGDEEYHFLPLPSDKQRVNVVISNDYLEQQQGQLAMDEEWMNDNSGIEGSGGGAGGSSEKKKKKKKPVK